MRIEITKSLMFAMEAVRAALAELGKKSPYLAGSWVQTNIIMDEGEDTGTKKFAMAVVLHNNFWLHASGWIYKSPEGYRNPGQDGPRGKEWTWGRVEISNTLIHFSFKYTPNNDRPIIKT